ncbi:MAG: preprotein translocase subunit SecG [Gammaproteobacteria bacterium]|nr:preprotein translocase subunit SecG [Gammaproteobacteria bacterium]
MQTIFVIIHLFLALGLIGLVLMQHGKGADAGAAFGSGSSGTVFGATGAANFLSRATAFLATLFFVTSMALAWFAMQVTDQPGLMDSVDVKLQEAPPEADFPAIPGQAPVPRQSEVPVIPGQAAPAASPSSVPVVPDQASAEASTEVPVAVPAPPVAGEGEPKPTE